MKLKLYAEAERRAAAPVEIIESTEFPPGFVFVHGKLRKSGKRTGKKKFLPQERTAIQRARKKERQALTKSVVSAVLDGVLDE